MFENDDECRWAKEAMRVTSTIVGIVSIGCLSIVLWHHGGAIMTELF